MKNLYVIRYKTEFSLPIAPFFADIETVQILKESLSYLSFMKYICTAKAQSDFYQYDTHKASVWIDINKRCSSYFELNTVGLVSLHQKQSQKLRKIVRVNKQKIIKAVKLVYPGANVEDWLIQRRSHRSNYSKGLGLDKEHKYPTIQYFYYMREDPRLHVMKLSEFNEWNQEGLQALANVLSLTGVVDIYQSKKSGLVFPIKEAKKLRFIRDDGCMGEIWIARENISKITNQLKEIGYKKSKSQKDIGFLTQSIDLKGND